jgi:hypothetical protein
MILYLDIRRDHVALAAVDAKSAKWLDLKGDNKVGAALAKAKLSLGIGRRKPKAVVVAVNAADATPETRNVSWSGIRQGIATANALAFAWGVPVCSLEVRGDEARTALREPILTAAKKAKDGVWVRAAYDGEPNITVAKKIL